MPLLPRLLLTCLAAAGATAAEERIGAFDVYQEGWVLGLGPEFPGAQARAAIDGKLMKSGGGSLRLEPDFTRGGGYVQVAKTFPEGLAAKSITFWTQSEGVAGIRFRLVDATGQVFQSRKVPIPEGKGWKRMTLPLADLCAAEHWGGANDGIWHPPGRTIAIMIPASFLAEGLTTGAIWLDELAAVLDAGAKPSAAREAVKLVELDDCDHGTDGWQFTPGSEFPGATGGIAAESVNEPGAKPAKKNGSVRLDADFTGGGQYVAATRSFGDGAQDVRELRLRVKSSAIDHMGVRLIDGTGQCHQMGGGGVQVGSSDGWREIVVQPVQVVGGEHWGGANDGLWHPPLKAVSLAIGAGRVDGTKASLWIDEIRAVVVPEAKPR